MDDYSVELQRMGARIRAIRKHKGLKLLDLETATGIYDSEISRIERGLVKVEVQTVYKLAKALQIELKEIFDYDGPLPYNAKK